MREAKKYRQWASGDGGVSQAEEEKVGKHLTCGGDGQREVVGGKTLKIGCGSDHGLNKTGESLP